MANMTTGLSNAVWDIENGVFVKLTEGKIVSHAVRGFTALTKQEITKLYGQPPVFS
jgi:hypothetical protein